jgi:serine/threonine-protein kinase HipA
MKSLDVYLDERLVGTLSRSTGGLCFSYSVEYLGLPAPLPLSRHLPIETGLPPQIFEDQASRAFFENLLPEGDVRSQVARNLGVSRENTFELLAALGGDCAGAVSLLPPGEKQRRTGHYRPISRDNLAEELDRLPSHPFLADEEGVRLSLAGAQNKLPIYYDGNEFYVPEEGAPSTHIIKTPIKNLENTVVNEAFCMDLAAQVGLNVPRTDVVELGGSQYFLIERYDRQTTLAGRIERLHQEDFCQALGIPPAEKYEKEGGPGFGACFGLLRAWSSEPFPDVAALLQWALFNFLIGNADAHGKNISFLYAGGQVRLAPLYDLISTAVYQRQVNNKFAMKFGGEKDPRYLLTRHLNQFADDAGIGYRAVKVALQNMAKDLKRIAPVLADEYRERFAAPVIVNRLVEIIEQRVAKAEFLLSGKQ